MTNWYTADLHFNHASIIRHCARPFATAGEMDKEILQRLQCVGEDEDLWILGDFAFAKNAKSRRYVAEIFAAIPGRKHLVRGNHDHKSTQNLPWASVQDLVEIKDQGQDLVLCHYPLITWNKARYGALHLFGHVHDDFTGFRGALNVGVDCCDFRPLKLFEIRSRVVRFETQPPFSFDSDSNVENKNT